MQKVIVYVKNKIAFAAAIVIAVFLGSFANNFVNASVPSPSGLISACYRTKGGDLRVIDTANPSNTCSNKETPLSWGQQPANNIAYVTVVGEGGDNSTATIDTLHSKGFSNLQVSPVDSAYVCMTVNFTPKFGYSTDVSRTNFAFKDENNQWIYGSDTNYTNQCDAIPGANFVYGGTVTRVSFVVY